jgi:predicted MFS family arabinose efflux permease
MSAGAVGRHALGKGASSLLIAWATLFIMGTDLLVPSPLLPLVARDYGIGVSVAGWTVSVFSLAYMLGAPLFGRIADRVGCRTVAVVGLGAFACANGVSALAGEFATLLAARGLCGLAASAVTPSIYSMVAAIAPAELRGRFLAVAVSGLLCALPAGTPLGAIAAASFGWRPVFLVLAAAGILAALANHAAWPARSDSGSGLRLADIVGPLALRVVPTVLWSTALYAVYTYLGAGLSRAGGDLGALPRVLLAYGVGAITGTFVGGWLADRLGGRLTMIVSLGGFACLLFGIRLFGLADPPPAASTALLFGLASLVAQFFFPAQQAALATDFSQRRTVALALNNSALFLGIFLGASLGGLVLGRHGFAGVVAAAAVLAVFGATYLELGYIRSSKRAALRARTGLGDR